MECTSRSWAELAQIPSRQSVTIIPITVSLYVIIKWSYIAIEDVESLVILF